MSDKKKDDNDKNIDKLTNIDSRSSFEKNIDRLEKKFPEQTKVIETVLNLVLNDFDDACDYLKNLINSENNDTPPLAIEDMIFTDWDSEEPFDKNRFKSNE